MELNGAYLFLLFTDYVNLLDQSMNAINKNTHALLYASKKTGLAVNAEKIKYMFTSRDTQYRSKNTSKLRQSSNTLDKPNQSKLHSLLN